jgi:AraC-like DNA-binding protein
MDSSIGELFLCHLSRSEYNHLGKINLNRDGHIELMPRRSWGEGLCLLKPAGKSLSVSVTDLSFREPIEFVSNDLPKYFHIALCRGTERGIGGAHIRKDGTYRQHRQAGFLHCGVGVSFLPDFFDTFFGSRYGIAEGELTEAINALGRFPLIPEASIILKQIGEASFTGDIRNAWIEGKTIELVSVILDWHRRLAATAGPVLKEYDRLGIACAMNYVDEHFSEPLTLEVLAKQAAMGLSKFTATFKTHTGLSAACYVRRIRMDKAMYLLKNTSVPLWDIAWMVGYKHQARFSTLFREKFGVSPGEFRKQDNRGKHSQTP